MRIISSWKNTGINNNIIDNKNIELILNNKEKTTYDKTLPSNYNNLLEIIKEYL